MEPDEKMPRIMKTALLLNVIGTALLIMSLAAASPFQFIITLVNGVALLVASFAMWVLMVAIEAWQKGMFK